MDESPRTDGTGRERRGHAERRRGVPAAPDGGPAVPLGRAEQRRARARKALGAQVVHEAIRKEGEEELVAALNPAQVVAGAGGTHAR